MAIIYTTPSGNVQTSVNTANRRDDGTSGSSSSGDKHYTHYQGVASTTWNVTHNLGKYPAVQVLDSAKNLVTGDVQHIDLNNTVLSFAYAFSGSATFN